MIRLEPIPNKCGEFRANAKAHSATNEQKIFFSVQVPKNDSVTKLATGEKLEDLEGSVRLHRGYCQMGEGQPFPNAIFYVPAFETRKSCFYVQIFIGEALFDQLLAFARSGFFASLDLTFGYVEGPIKYSSGGGHDKVWHNKDHEMAAIEEVLFDIPLKRP